MWFCESHRILAWTNARIKAAGQQFLTEFGDASGVLSERNFIVSRKHGRGIYIPAFQSKKLIQLRSRLQPLYSIYPELESYAAALENIPNLVISEDVKSDVYVFETDDKTATGVVLFDKLTSDVSAVVFPLPFIWN